MTETVIKIVVFCFGLLGFLVGVGGFAELLRLVYYRLCGRRAWGTVLRVEIDPGDSCFAVPVVQVLGAGGPFEVRGQGLSSFPHMLRVGKRVMVYYPPGRRGTAVLFTFTEVFNAATGCLFGMGMVVSCAIMWYTCF